MATEPSSTFPTLGFSMKQHEPGTRCQGFRESLFLTVDDSQLNHRELAYVKLAAGKVADFVMSREQPGISAAELRWRLTLLPFVLAMALATSIEANRECGLPIPGIAFRKGPTV